LSNRPAFFISPGQDTEIVLSKSTPFLIFPTGASCFKKSISWKIIIENGHGVLRVFLEIILKKSECFETV